MDDDEQDRGAHPGGSEAARTDEEPPACSVDGCGRWPMNHGYCNTHYQRWRRDGDPGGPVATRTAKRGRCSVPGCQRPDDRRGMCNAHYLRWWRTGEVGAAAVAGHVRHGPGCSVDGCDRPHMARGLCSTHYSRQWRTGNAGTKRPRRVHRCGKPHCGQRHYRQGMCQTHYRQWIESGATRAPLDVAVCAQTYRDGASATTLAKRFGYTPKAVRDALRAAGVTIRPRGRRRRTP